MKTVKLINDDFSNTEAIWAKNALIVGEEFPIKGDMYIVEEEFHDKIENIIAYQLEGFDYSAYGDEAGWFLASRFEIIEDVFTPNYVDEDTGKLFEKNYSIRNKWTL